MEKKEVITALIKNGAEEVKGLTVRNVTVTPMEDWIRLGITVDKEIDGYQANEAGEFEPAKVKTIFASAYTIASLLKDDDNAAFAANHLLKHPDAMGMILSRSKIDILQESVVKGQEYKNPFANEDSDSIVFEHDTIINHIAKLELGEFGIKLLDKLADKMLGF